MPVRSILLAALLSIAAPVAAQQQAIESQMTAEEFTAAGLHKLDDRELARLNAWLNRTIEGESTRAASEAREQAGSQLAGGGIDTRPAEPVESRLVGEFRGFARGREYVFENGQVWKQVDDAQLPGVRLDSPAVQLSRRVIGNAWYLRVEGYNTRTRVERIR